MSTFIEYCKSELEKIGLLDKNSPYNGMLGKAILNDCITFSKEGHSGCSASLSSTLSNRLKNFLPLSPLKGTPDEWTLVSTNLLQNKRCPKVFWDLSTNKINQLDGYIFEDLDGYSFSCNVSKIEIEFPYTVPKNPIYVKEGTLLYWWLLGGNRVYNRK